MSHKVNLVRVLTAATGNSTPITLGTKYSNLFMTPAEAGAMDGRVYTYLIVDGNDFEIGRGAYTASGTSLARTTVLYSRIAGTLGTSRISLSGTAQVRFIESAEDMDGMRGTRAVTGTSDTLNNSDLGFVVTYSNASAVAVSLAQPSVSNLFLDGWAVWVKNRGIGAVTITPATSTIDGAANLVLAQNQGALIWSDGTNYQSFIFRGDIGVPVRADAAQSLTSTQQAQAQKNLGLPAVMRSYLAGLSLSTPGSSTSFTVAPGVATDSTNVDMMTLTAALTKTTANWAVGSGNGGFDTASTLGNNLWYHVFLIKRVDTGVVDAFFSQYNPPALPTNYTLARRIGSMRTNGSAQWIKFIQDGDQFLWETPVNDVIASNPPTTAVTRTLTVPTGVRVEALCSAGVVCGGSDQFVAFFVTDLQTADTAPTNSGPFTFLGFTNGVAPQLGGQIRVMTNTSAQVRSRLAGSGANTQLLINSHGWVDRRGRDA